MAIPARVSTRMLAGLKQFRPILTSARSRDVNEADTVVLVMDILQDVFGYDKFTELTREYVIRGTYCDLAIKLDGTLTCLVEVKAIGLDLKDAFVKQAVDYAANQGVEWVFLTNGIIWRAYRVAFGKPVTNELAVELDLLEINPRLDASIELLYLLSREGWQKARLAEQQALREAVNRFMIGALIISDPVAGLLRRELRRLSPGVQIDITEVQDVLVNEVLKREVLEGDKAQAARKVVAKATSKRVPQSHNANSAPAPLTQAAVKPTAAVVVS